MPGLSGLFARTGQPGSDAENDLTTMLQAQMHQPWLQVHRYAEGVFAVGRVHLGTYPTWDRPACGQTRRYALWVDGEIYNRLELADAYGLEGFASSGDAQFLLDLYLSRHG